MPSCKVLTCTLSLLVMYSTITAQTAEQYEAKSDSYYYMKKYDSALIYAQKAETIIVRDSGVNSIRYAYFVGQFYGMNYEAKGDLKSAGYWYKTSVDLFNALHDTLSIGYGETLANYGNFLNMMGFDSMALPYLLLAERNLRPYAMQGNSYPAALNNLANSYTSIGLYSKAEKSFLKVLILIKTIFRKEENFQAANVYSNLAIVYNRSGQYKKAEVNFAKAIYIFKKIEYRKEYYKTYFNLGEFYSGRRKTDTALAIYKEVGDSISPKENLELHVAAVNGIGQSKYQQGKKAEAEFYFLKGIDLIGQGEKEFKPTIYFSLGYNLAVVYAAANKPRKADSIYRSLIQEFHLSDNRDQHSYLQVYSGFCANLIRINKVREASDSLQSLMKHLFLSIDRNMEGMPHDNKMRFVQTLKTSFDLIYSLLASAKSNDKDLVRQGFYNALRLKGAILSGQAQLLNDVRNSPDTTLIATFLAWQKTQQILYYEYLKTAGNRIFDIDSLEAAVNGFEREFTSAGLTSLSGDKHDAFQKVQSSLSTQEAAIEFVRYSFTSAKRPQIVYGAFIIKKDLPDPVFVVLCDEAKLLPLFKNKQGRSIGTENQLKPSFQQGANSLYTLLWQPLQQHLTGIKKIYYSPAGMLNSIAFNAIKKADGQLLMDVYKMHLVLSTRKVIPQAKALPLPSFASIWGDINYREEVYLRDTAKRAEESITAIDRNMLGENITKGGLNARWNALPADETNALQQLFSGKNIPVQTFTGSMATEEQFKKAVNEFSGVVHISTHGFFAASDPEEPEVDGQMYTTHANPMLRCGLIFAGGNYVWAGNEPIPEKDDGILTGYEIAQMDLRKVSLVVLSACETGLGDLDKGDEGVIGLQRALKLAGADQLIVSLWKVPPRQTQELMIAFYRNLLAGNTASDALLSAQKEMRKKYTAFGWAAFVLIE